MTVVFDGKGYAAGVEVRLKERIASLGKSPSLRIVMVGKDKGSEIYVAKKKEVGERVGIKVEVVRLARADEGELEKLVSRSESDGVMIQLPIPGLDGEETEKVVGFIPLDKDVDGLNAKSMERLGLGEPGFVPAVARAVGRIMDEAMRELRLDIERLKIAVVGAKGRVGRGICSQLERFGFEVLQLDAGDDLARLKQAQVVISAVGKAGVIKPKHVAYGVVAIDVGYPKGDLAPEVEKKAAFWTPVPNGVGPVTVVSLLENVIDGLYDVVE